MENLSALIQKEESDPQKLFEIECAANYLRYLFHTPTALLTLCFKNIINEKELKTLLNDAKFLQMLQLQSENHKEILFSCYEVLTILNKFKKIRDKQLVKGFTEYCLNLLENHSFQVLIFLLTMMDTFEMSLNDWKGKPESYNKIVEALDLFISEFTKDVDQLEISEKYLLECKKKILVLPENIEDFFKHNWINSFGAHSPEFRDAITTFFNMVHDKKIKISDVIEKFNKAKSNYLKA